MALMFGAQKKSSQNEENGLKDQRLINSRDLYLAGKIKIVTTDDIPNRQVSGTFGLIVCRSYTFDNAFYGLVAQALEVNADSIIAYRENVAFHPEGDRYYSCYGTAVRLKPE
ncbi:MAG: hypothetical protein KKB70_10245 [Proteobacteria bacterium]|nr:hypothetical protein [Pseudomonadota bacterium]MBU1611756.1 hypothetical protein [Pseudomonadota bacterium]